MNPENPQKPIDRIPPNGFPAGFRALVIGASGAIGTAMVAQLRADPACSAVVALHRRSQPAIDFEREDSIAAAAAELAAQAPFHLIVNAAGLLHANSFMPEKKLGDIEMTQMLDTFRVNTFGPALLLRHFSRLLDRQRGVMALLSAKVGSIEDNRLGGWYSYRASKAALNQILRTLSVELHRTHPDAIVAGLHPGTVRTGLSHPFRPGPDSPDTVSPETAAAHLLRVLDGLTPAESGGVYAWDGQPVPP